MKFRSIFVCVCFILCLGQVLSAATYTVTKIGDTNDGMCDADCSFREAIAAANATADGDLINFSMPFFVVSRTITLSGTEIVIANNGSLTINGTGVNRLTISGNNASRIISISDDAVVNIHHIRFTGGTGAGAANTGRAGAVYNNGGTTLISNCVFTGNSAANGGAMNNATTGGVLTIANSVLSNNNATSVGGALQNFSTSTLHLINTAITGNSSGTASTGGGAIQGNGMITMTNVTMSGNSTLASGGGIYYNGTGLTMTNTTISNNTAATNAGGFHKSTATNNANIRNSIIANNTGGASPDVTNVINSLGNNIIGTVGTSTGWVASDLQNTNPLLAPLGFYGGNGFSRALLNGSPAINGGQNCVKDLTCATNNPPVMVAADQRGANRADTVDIGAFEINPSYIAVLPYASLTLAYNETIIPDNAGFNYCISSGALPPGLTGISPCLQSLSAKEQRFSPDAVIAITGTPTATGTYDFTVVGTMGGTSTTTNYRLAVNVEPSAASVSVGGRILTPDGRGLTNARIYLTDSGGTRQAISSAFGYYRFDDIGVGQTVVVTVVSKRYTFTPQVITVNDDMEDLNFTAEQ